MGVLAVFVPIEAGWLVLMVGGECSWTVVDEGVLSWRSLLGRRREMPLAEVCGLRRYGIQKRRCLSVTDGDKVCRLSSRMHGFDDVEAALLSMGSVAVRGPSAYERRVLGAKPIERQGASGNHAE